MIDITDVNMVDFVKAVYDLSRPQGLGMMHFTPSPMTDQEAKAIINSDGTVNMDYISGRACKMNTHLQDGRIVMGDAWYDHSDSQLKTLMERVGIEYPTDTPPASHGCACNCDVCRNSRGENDYDPMASFKDLFPDF